jgi:hypothetical protein
MAAGRVWDRSYTALTPSDALFLPALNDLPLLLTPLMAAAARVWGRSSVALMHRLTSCSELQLLLPMPPSSLSDLLHLPTALMAAGRALDRSCTALTARARTPSTLSGLLLLLPTRHGQRLLCLQVCCPPFSQRLLQYI